MSTSEQFASPSSSAGIEWATLNGCLLIIEVKEVVHDINTSMGMRNATRATVTIVDGPTAGTAFEDTLIFPKVLHSQTASKIGKTVLGRLSQGVAKPSQNPPWILTEATADDLKAAGEFMAARAAGTLTADDI